MRVNSNASLQSSYQITVDCITNYAEFQALQNDWDELHQNSIFPSIYNTFLFLDESIKAFSTDNTELRIYLLKKESNQQIIAIFPFQISFDRWHRLPYNELGMACVNDNLDKPYPVIREGHHDITWQILIETLKQSPKDWQHLFLRDIPTFLPTLKCLPEYCQNSGLVYQSVFDTTGPRINLNGDWDTFFRKHRSLKRKCKRLDKDFGDRVRFEIIENNWEWCLEQYNKVERKTWKAESGIDSNANTRAFYQSVLAKLSEQRRLIFGFLFIDDKIIAAEIVYLHQDTAYFPHACFDPEYQQYSPSMIGNAWMLRHLYETPYQIGDYLCGYANYMNSWSDEIVETYDIYIYRLGPVVLLRLGFSKIRQVLRAIKKRLRPSTPTQT